MLTVFLRTLCIYIMLTGVMRLMGKRQIGELQLSELICALLLSEIATAPISDPRIPLIRSIVPIAALISLEIIITFIATRSTFCKKLFDGTPSILIKNGELQQDELSRLRMSLEELLGELRLKGVSDIGDVEYAIIEQNGKLSVFEKAARGKVRPEDLKLKPKEHGISHALITDGHISEYNLTLLGYPRTRLESRLRELNLSPNQIFLFAVDDAGQETVIRRN